MSGLKSDSLINHGGEVGEDVQSQCKLEICVESITELLLPTCIIGEVTCSIAGEAKEFPLICLDSFVALSEVAKLGLHTVHNCLGNITSTEGSLEVILGDDSPFS